MSRIYVCTGINIPKDRLPSAPPHTNVVDLIKVYEGLGNICILGDQSDGFLFRQLMLAFNVSLLGTREAAERSSRKKIYGFELMDIISEPGQGTCTKELKLDLAGKDWADITKVVDALVVCGNLGDAITAGDDSDAQNKQCNKLPRGSDYLAATVPCLKRLVEKRGGDLHGDIQAQVFPIVEKVFLGSCTGPIHPMFR